MQAFETVAAGDGPAEGTEAVPEANDRELSDVLLDDTEGTRLLPAPDSTCDVVKVFVPAGLSVSRARRARGMRTIAVSGLRTLLGAGA